MDVPAVPLTNPTARPWKSWKGVEVLAGNHWEPGEAGGLKLPKSPNAECLGFWKTKT